MKRLTDTLHPQIKANLKSIGRKGRSEAKHKALEKVKRTPYSEAAKADQEEARKYPRLHKRIYE